MQAQPLFAALEGMIARRWNGVAGADAGAVSGFTIREFHDAMRFDRQSIPARMSMSVDEVVEASLRGLDGGRRTLAIRYARETRRVR